MRGCCRSGASPGAFSLGKEVEAALSGLHYRDFLKNMYGSKPDEWSEGLARWDRLRVIVNAMTRMRFCTPEGRMDFKAKGKSAPRGYRALVRAATERQGADRLRALVGARAEARAEARRAR